MPRKDWAREYFEGKVTLEEVVQAGWQSQLRKRLLAEVGLNREAKPSVQEWTEFQKKFSPLAQLGYRLEKWAALYPGWVYCQRNRRENGGSITSCTSFYTVTQRVTIWKVIPPESAAVITTPWLYVAKGTVYINYTVNPFRTHWSGFRPWKEAFPGVQNAAGEEVLPDSIIYSGM